MARIKRSAGSQKVLLVLEISLRLIYDAIDLVQGEAEPIGRNLVSTEDYAGELMPLEAWELLEKEPGATLVDVRTEAEWAYVGIPDLSALGRQPLFISWALFPKMEANPTFAEEIAAAGVAPDAPLLFLCRSGVRSKSGAIAMTALGHTRCYNVTHGFEGDPDTAKHRGGVNGWKIDRLPWVQG